MLPIPKNTGVFSVSLSVSLYWLCSYDTMVMTMVIIGDEDMRTIKASEFKAKCLKIMDEVAATGERVLITKNGVPVAELVPARRKPKALFGSMKGSVTYMGDIISPIDVQWEAEGE